MPSSSSIEAKIFSHLLAAAKDMLEEKSALIASLGADLAGNSSGFSLQPPREASQGDLAANLAFLMARELKRPPADIASAIVAKLGKLAQDPSIDKIEAVGGFINFRLSNAYWWSLLGDILLSEGKFGDTNIGKGEGVNVEFVSANPTGPLHIAHARIAVVGDVVANILEATGHKVTREYYINDAGGQIEALAESVSFRMRQLLGQEGDGEPESYPAPYVIEHAKTLLEQNIKPSDENLPSLAVDIIMEDIKRDLEDLGVKIERFSSERELISSGKLDRLLAELKKRKLVYWGRLPPPKSVTKAKKAQAETQAKTKEDVQGAVQEPEKGREQWLVRTSSFGDSQDRPLERENGSPTYFAVDSAYHLDKLERLRGGFLVDVLGSGHDGYVPRIRAVLQSMDAGRLDVVLCQLVRVMVDGRIVKLSKRAGNILTLRKVMDLVGRDVLRFALITRSSDTPLDIDAQKLEEQSRDNVVFYVHYAHARLASLRRKAQDEGLKLEAKADFSLLDRPIELALIRQLGQWPRQLRLAAEFREPHRLTIFLEKLAAAVHELWSEARGKPQARFLVADNPQLTLARLALAEAARLVIKSALDIFGVNARDRL